MSLARTILEQNIDPTFVDDILMHNVLRNRSELAFLLKQWRDSRFTKELINYMFLDYDDDIKNIIKSSYHPFFLNQLRSWTISQWYDHWNIAQHVFQDKESIEIFFWQETSIALDKNDIDAITKNTIDSWYMLYASSHIFGIQDALYFLFSSVAPKEPMKSDGMIKFTIKESKFYEKKWDGLVAVSDYLKSKFPENNIFDVMGIDAEKIL